MPRGTEPPLPTQDPFRAALRALLGELVREAVLDAVAELREAEQPRPVLLTSEQLGQAIQVSRATLHRLRHDGLPTLIVGDGLRFDLQAVLRWIEQRTTSSNVEAQPSEGAADFT